MPWSVCSRRTGVTSFKITIEVIRLCSVVDQWLMRMGHVPVLSLLNVQHCHSVRWQRPSLLHSACSSLGLLNLGICSSVIIGMFLFAVVCRLIDSGFSSWTGFPESVFSSYQQATLQLSTTVHQRLPSMTRSKQLSIECSSIDGCRRFLTMDSFKAVLRKNAVTLVTIVSTWWSWSQYSWVCLADCQLSYEFWFLGWSLPSIRFVGRIVLIWHKHISLSPDAIASSMDASPFPHLPACLIRELCSLMSRTSCLMKSLKGLFHQNSFLSPQISILNWLCADYFCLSLSDCDCLLPLAWLLYDREDQCNQHSLSYWITRAF